MVELQKLSDEFLKLNTVVVAIAQEDTDLEKHKKFYTNFKGGPKFLIGADLDGASLTTYGRTSTYLIDLRGKVRQVFPQLIHHRASWQTILNEIKSRQSARPAPATSRPGG